VNLDCDFVAYVCYNVDDRHTEKTRLFNPFLMSIKLTFPVKPESQNSFHFRRGGRSIIKTKNRKWRSDIQNFLYEQKLKRKYKPFTDEKLFASYTFNFADNTRRDTFNFEKPFTDSVGGILFNNDCQIVDGLVKRRINKHEEPSIEFEIHEYKNNITILGTPEQLAEVSKYANKLKAIIV